MVDNKDTQETSFEPNKEVKNFSIDPQVITGRGRIRYGLTVAAAAATLSLVILTAVPGCSLLRIDKVLNNNAPVLTNPASEVLSAPRVNYSGPLIIETRCADDDISHIELTVGQAKGQDMIAGRSGVFTAVKDIQSGREVITSYEGYDTSYTGFASHGEVTSIRGQAPLPLYGGVPYKITVFRSEYTNNLPTIEDSKIVASAVITPPNCPGVISFDN